MVGAYNGLWAYGKKTGQFDMPRMKDLFDYEEAKKVFKKLRIPPIKIALTGTGRVAQGASKVLDDMGIEKVTPIDYVTHVYGHPVYCQLSCFYYVKRIDGKTFESPQDFFDHPIQYESDFHHFIPMSDIMINGIYWDNRAPQFFTLEDMKKPDFGIKVIADVTCDIAPVSSIPSTIKASTIADPVFGFDPVTEKEVPPFSKNAIDMMTIDNLPNELPRDASSAFGEMFLTHVFPELSKPSSEMLEKATVAENGKLGKHFGYLSDYLNGA